MAAKTDINLRSKVIYSVYIRNHTEEGTFKAIIPDLPRIKALGTDIVWFMPIHPIGVEGRKGSLGCPYANRDYRTANPEYGTIDDFKALADAVHKNGMLVMIDVVYNHTSPDSVLLKEHPEYFYHDKNGKISGKTPEWSDVIDLDYTKSGLWDYQIETLKCWAKIVDGFRCDVASCVPVSFWERARAEVEKVRPGCIWLAETIHTKFNLCYRSMGYTAESDSDMYRAFDIEYDYDIRDVFERYLRGEIALSHFIDMMNLQEAVYPDNYIKMRCLENHDRERICSYIKDDLMVKNYTAMLYFLKGTTLIYAGQEFENDFLPSLFEKQTFDRNTGKNLSNFMVNLNRIKKTVLEPDDYFFGSADDDSDTAVLLRDNGKIKKLGLFSLKAEKSEIKVPFADGEYEDMISGEKINIKDGCLNTIGKPMVLVSNSR